MTFKTKSLKVANLLQKNHSEVLLLWRNQLHVQEVLNSKQINIDFFIKHFGSRVLNYFIGVLQTENKAGQCPIIMIMLRYFKNHGLKLEDVFRICSGMRHSVIYTILDNGIVHKDENYAISAQLFDTNFAGVIREYTEMYYSINSYKELPFCHLAFPVSESISSEKSSCTLSIDNSLMEGYFDTSTDDVDKVLFRTDDTDDLLEYFSEVPERLSLAMINSDFSEIKSVANIFSKTSSILLHYTPYLDSLAASMSELSTALIEHSDVFMEALKNSNDAMLKLFDAVHADMDRYIERFSIESMAMKNMHHIHEPTTVSIRQIIAAFAPDQIEEGEMEFF